MNNTGEKAVTYELPVDVIKLIDDASKQKRIEAGHKIPKRIIVAQSLRSQLGQPSTINECSLIIWRTGPNGGCTYLSPAWQKLTGHAKQQDLGTDWIDCIHPQDLPTVLEIWRSASSRRKAFWVQYRLRCANSRYVWIRGHGQPKFGPKKEFLGYIGSAIEIENPKAVVGIDSLIPAA